MGNYVHTCGRGTDIHEGGGQTFKKRLGWIFINGGADIPSGGDRNSGEGGGQKMENSEKELSKISLSLRKIREILKIRM